MKHNAPRTPGELRRQAEELLKEKQTSEVGSQDGTGTADTAKNYHELCVHQIELEMQNEELHSAQAEIEAERARYFDLYDLAPVSYVTVSGQGLILEANRTAAILLGMNRGALVKQVLTRFILKEDQDIYYLHRKKLFETGEPQKFELRLVKPDGTQLWVLLNATDAEAPDGAPACRVALSDISEQKLAEEMLRETNQNLEAATARANEMAMQAEKANRAKSAFLANMSHEIRTPLNAILGFAQILERDASLTPRQTGMLHTIARSGRHLLDLINDILNMSKIEAGKLELSPVDFCLHDLLDGLEMMFQSRAHAKQLQLLMERDNRVPRYVNADEGKLRQVLINLMGNAVKFTTTGWVAVRVRSETAADSSVDGEKTIRLVVEVEDSGPGIATEELDRIFEPFRQSAGGRDAGGTGLGLAVSRCIVELMGGSLTVKSEVGKGSCFRFDLLVTPAEGAAQEKKQEAQQVVGLEPGTGQDKGDIRPLTRDDLATLPDALRQAMRQAVDEGDMAGLQILIAQIEETEAETSRKLGNLADQYDYGTLTRVLTKQAEGETND